MLVQNLITGEDRTNIGYCSPLAYRFGADFRAFQIPCEDAVAAAWIDEHGRAAGLLFRRRKNGDRRLRDIADAHQALPGDEAVGGLRGVGFGWEVSFFSRCRVWPKRERLRLIRAAREGWQQEDRGDGGEEDLHGDESSRAAALTQAGMRRLNVEG